MVNNSIEKILSRTPSQGSSDISPMLFKSFVLSISHRSSQMIIKALMTVVSKDCKITNNYTDAVTEKLIISLAREQEAYLK